jgi:hypothetical protein
VNSIGPDAWPQIHKNREIILKNSFGGKDGFGPFLK